MRDQTALEDVGAEPFPAAAAAQAAQTASPSLGPVCRTARSTSALPGQDVKEKTQYLSSHSKNEPTVNLLLSVSKAPASHQGWNFHLGLAGTGL